MTGVVLVAHAPVAGAMLSCIVHVLGRTPDHVVAVDILPDADVAQSRKQLEQAFEMVDQAQASSFWPICSGPRRATWPWK